MAFIQKTWKDRLTEYPTRRILSKSDGSMELVTVSRSEGTVSQAGDAFSAANMNDLETRIANALNSITISVDTTLTQSGMAADAKAVGDAISSLNSGVRYNADTDMVQLLSAGGTWVDWKYGGLNVTYLYNEGEFNTDIISGFINGTDGSSDVADKSYSTGTNSVSTAVTTNNTSTTILTATKVDLTNYSTLGATIFEGSTERNIELDISSLSGSYYVGIKHWYKDSKISSWLLTSGNTNTNSNTGNMQVFNRFNNVVTKTDSNLNITMTKLWLK